MTPTEATATRLMSLLNAQDRIDAHLFALAADLLRRAAQIDDPAVRPLYHAARRAWLEAQELAEDRSLLCRRGAFVEGSPHRAELRDLDRRLSAAKRQVSMAVCRLAEHLVSDDEPTLALLEHVDRSLDRIVGPDPETTSAWRLLESIATRSAPAD